MTSLQQICVFMFDWQWNYLGHGLHDLNTEVIQKLKDSPVAAHELSMKTARMIGIPDDIKDVHTAMALVDGNSLSGGEVEITPELIEQIKSMHSQNKVRKSEEWDFGNYKVQSHEGKP